MTFQTDVAVPKNLILFLFGLNCQYHQGMYGNYLLQNDFRNGKCVFFFCFIMFCFSKITVKNGLCYHINPGELDLKYSKTRKIFI